ncbi:MAG: ABC transporter ATP-binding protein [Bacteroidales bacterium]|jgi:iron complex transport system ATP-binding protein|nr:ABC transporter ATP-binding protein [Bacteroidales bacterium]
MIELSDIRFSYNSSAVIKGISHHFEKGSFTAILGPNGSGKTTLLKLLNNILKPQNGKIMLSGKDIRNLSPRQLAKHVGYVPQFQSNMFPATVFDTVLLGRNPYIRWSPGEDDKRIASEILVRLHLDDIALKDVNHLSGGQRQRVFIARALAQQPEVILLDEPTANLDIRYQHEVFELLGKLSRSGITIIMAIHDLNQALNHCGDFVLMDDGVIAARGDKKIFSEEQLEKIYKVRIKIFREEDHTYILPF